MRTSKDIPRSLRVAVDLDPNLLPNNKWDNFRKETVMSGFLPRSITKFVCEFSTQICSAEEMQIIYDRAYWFPKFNAVFKSRLKQCYA